MTKRERLRVAGWVAALCCAPLAFACRGASTPPLAAAPSSSADRTLPLEVVTERGVLRVRFVSEGAVRVLWTRSATTSVPASFALDPLTNERRPPVPYRLETHGDTLLMRGSELSLRITKHPLALSLLNAAGEVLSEQSAPVAWSELGYSATWPLHDGEQVYGLGDKVRGFDRRGQAFELWNTDAYGWSPESDPLYKSIPFSVFLNGGNAYGLFIDTPARAQVDVGKSLRDTFRFSADVGDSLDFYWFAGPDPKRVVQAYTELTGKTPLPPRWALGYHQSRYSYMSEREVRDVGMRLRADAIPSDALWLDIDYQQGNSPFTVDGQAFPNFTGMVKDLAQVGLRTVVITDPHPKSYQGAALPSGYAPFDSGAAGDHFLHDEHGGFLEAKVWPGLSVFPEFTLSRTRRWWGDLYAGFVEQGVAGFWNDMNEPAAFNDDKTLPASARHRFDDGTTLSHSFVHNAYGGLNARATYEGLRRLAPGTRPFVLTRAAYAGTQRYAATWTGDNSATREHLALSIAQLENLGVSGYAFSGADVGGFVGCPDPDLLVEWLEVGALTPFFRNHSAKDSCRREPWLLGPSGEARVRAAIERRYRLLPYLYTLFEESARTGLPILRPLWLEYPRDAASQRNASSFLLGTDLLVAPKLVPGNVGYDVQLPHAAFWDAVDGVLLPAGGTVHVPASNDSVRLFARAGAIIPRQALTQTAAETASGPLELEVWPGPSCSGNLYLDDGRSFAFEAGAYRRVEFTCQSDAAGIVISARSSGAFPPFWQESRLVVHGVPRAPRSASDGAGATLAFEYDERHQRATLHVPSASADFAARLSY